MSAPQQIDLDPIPDESALTAFSSPDADATPWATTLDAIRRAQLFWLTTVRPDGRPHTTPVLGVWALGGFCFCTGGNERKARNLDASAHVTMSTGTNALAGLDVVVHGDATPVTDEDERASAAQAFVDAYGWHLTSPAGTWHFMPDAIRAGEVRLYLVRPVSGFAYAKGVAFGETRYRWSR